MGLTAILAHKATTGLEGAPPEDMQVAAKVTLGSTYVEIEGAAHIANINQADAFNMTIAKFLGL